MKSENYGCSKAPRRSVLMLLIMGISFQMACQSSNIRSTNSSKQAPLESTQPVQFGKEERWSKQMPAALWILSDAFSLAFLTTSNGATACDEVYAEAIVRERVLVLPLDADKNKARIQFASQQQVSGFQIGFMNPKHTPWFFPCKPTTSSLEERRQSLARFILIPFFLAEKSAMASDLPSFRLLLDTFFLEMNDSAWQVILQECGGASLYRIPEHDSILSKVGVGKDAKFALISLSQAAVNKAEIDLAIREILAQEVPELGSRKLLFEFPFEGKKSEINAN